MGTLQNCVNILKSTDFSFSVHNTNTKWAITVLISNNYQKLPMFYIRKKVSMNLHEFTIRMLNFYFFHHHTSSQNAFGGFECFPPEPCKIVLYS